MDVPRAGLDGVIDEFIQREGRGFIADVADAFHEGVGKDETVLEPLRLQLLDKVALTLKVQTQVELVAVLSFVLLHIVFFPGSYLGRCSDRTTTWLFAAVGPFAGGENRQFQISSDRSLRSAEDINWLTRGADAPISTAASFDCQPSR